MDNAVPFLIYSEKYHAWYRPDAAGYANDIAQAGVFAGRGVENHERKVYLDEAYADLLRRRAELHDALARTYFVEAKLLGLLELPRARPVADVSAMRIEELELSIRSANCLRPHAETVGDLVAMTAADLRRIPHLGVRSLREVREVLAVMKLRLRGDE